MTPPDTAALRPIDVPCPTCGVAKWTPCQGTEAGIGYLAGTTEPHPARVEAARATTTAATVCGDSPTGVPGCHAAIGYYVEWTEGGIMHLAATLCDLHTADLRAGHSPYPDADCWPVDVTRVRDIDSHDALCRASRKALFDRIDAEREAGNA